MNTMTVIQIELTTRCNRHCIMCNRQSTTHDMTCDIATCICENIPTLEHIHIAGGGEPFLHPYIDRILDIFEHYNIPVSIVTNGSIQHNTWDRFSEVIMSIHDVDPIRYRQITGGDISEVIPNIQYASLAYNVVTSINGPYIKHIEYMERVYGAKHIFSVPVKEWFITGPMIDIQQYLFPLPYQLPFTSEDPPEARRIFISATGGVVPWCSRLDPNKYICGDITKDNISDILYNISACKFRCTNDYL